MRAAGFFAILLFSTNVEASKNELELKGFIPGKMTRVEALSHAKAKGLSLICAKEGDYCLVDGATLANRRVDYLELSFGEGILVMVGAGGDSRDVEFISKALRKKFGKPTDESSMRDNQSGSQSGLHRCWDETDSVLCAGRIRLVVNTVSDDAGKGTIRFFYVPISQEAIKKIEQDYFVPQSAVDDL